jgi:phage FluMu gp28-like protein
MTSTAQRDALERLRGNPQPETPRLKVASDAWTKLSRAIHTALEFPNVTLTASIAELQAIFERGTVGINCNGWENPYPKDDPRHLLKQWQHTSFEDSHQFILDVWSRQTGKDFTLAMRAGADAVSQKKIQWTIAAPSERQSLESLEKAKDVVLAFGDVIADFQEDRESPEALIKSAMITTRNGSRIRAVPGMPHTVRGLTGSVGITEADFLEKPKETMRALLGSIANEETGRKNIRLITTPNGKSGVSHKIFNDAESIYSKRLITIWHAVCMGLKQNPRVLEKALDDPEGWAQEFLCEWLDSSAVLLTYELIQGCESFEASEVDTPELLAQSKLGKIAGIDFGRVNDPTVMITAETGLSMKIVRNITRLKGMSTPDQLRILAPYMALCRRVCVDYTGPGIGFGDLAAEMFGEWKPAEHKFGKIELCTFTVPFKREIFPALRLAFEKRDIRIPVSAWFREDLHSMAQVINGGQYNYKAPRSDAGHSDGCTALALMNRAGEGPSVPFAFSPAKTNSNPRESLARRAGRLFGL